MSKRVLGLVVLAGVVAGVLFNLHDISRYIRIGRM